MLDCKSESKHGRIARQSGATTRLTNCRTSNRFEKMLLASFHKCCKIRCVVWTRPTKRFSVEYQPTKLPHNSNNIGIDVGLEAFATLSDGVRIENHRYYKAAQAKLRRAQRKMARRQNKKSKRRHKAILLLQKAYQHVANQRKD